MVQHVTRKYKRYIFMAGSCSAFILKSVFLELVSTEFQYIQFL